MSDLSADHSCRCFSLAEIQSITNNFNEELVIGIGGFGKVYKGFIDNGATAVAIKRLKAESNQGAEEFWNEVKLLSKLRHTHLVALIGLSSDCEEMILVYEYMAGGTLADHLYKTSRNQTQITTFHLTWERRLNICIGAARGLDYLHTGTDQSFIHRDVKTTNILLDENWVAKISDFGLSKGTPSHSAAHVTTRVKGTFGYLDPDYFYTQRLTKKSDVYAFGVVLLEVLCGRLPVDKRLEEEEISLIRWAQRHIEKGKVDRIIDPSLIGQITPQSLKYFVEVASNCLHTGSKERPTMAEVVGTLDLALLSQRKGQSCRRFSLSEIQSITNNFNEELVIGIGGSGKVYKGFIDNGATAVAIKRLKAESDQGAEEFWNEVKMLSKLRHTHLVALIGLCSDCEEMILVYDYMARGTLADHLYKTSRNQTEISTFRLTWERRLNICIGAARGLDYLHTGTDQSFIHRDVKTTNILLDENWVAKISDFGLSKGTTSHSATHVTTRVKGTFGYLDPDYFYTQRLTKKSDVYAFGVVLLEVLCGRPPVDKRLEKEGEEEISLIRWAQRHIERGKVDRIIDPSLIRQITPQSLKYFVEVASNCLHTGSKERPTMAEVVGTLDLALLSQRKGQSCRRFSLAEIQSMTNNFNEELVIGIGVYKGFIDNGATAVAIKRLKAESNQGAKEFWNEVKMLSKLRHTHLVSLIGLCSDCEEMILVYEYIARGTLSDHLYKTSRKQTEISTFRLTWERRLNICIGAARGLDYLHTGTDQSFIHRDVKTTNILLDENWVAKISDFGLSKGTTSHSATHVTTRVKGTFGYLDPDYFYTQRLTKKSDVYAFGVVLLEVLCGRPPVDKRLEEEGEKEINLIHWAQRHIEKGKVDRIIDPSLIRQITPQSLKYFVEVASNCLHTGSKERPTMAEVVGTLDLALLSQRKGPSGGMIGNVLQGTATVPKGMNRWWRERKENGFKSGPSNNSFWEPLPDSVTRQLRCFSLAYIRAATNDFSEDRLIQKGRLCKVYKGYLDGETGILAIKRFKELKSLQLWEEARVEIEVHSLLDSHPHIVSLIGFSNEKPELIGVYDYMTNGSLEDHLFNINSDPPLWKQRLKICIGVARGLQHLHSSAKHRVIHCNVKPANILLDENWVAKLIPNDIANESFTVSTKSDVYSFGMVLLSVLLCSKQLDTCLNKGEELPPSWFQSRCERGTIDQVIDPCLIGKIAPECFKEFVKMAMSCMLIRVIQRPSMDDVVTSLQLALQLQETWETRIKIGVETEPSYYNAIYSMMN